MSVFNHLWLKLTDNSETQSKIKNKIKQRGKNPNIESTNDSKQSKICLCNKHQSSHLSAYVLQKKSSLAKPASRLFSEMNSLCKYPPPLTARWLVHPSLAISLRVSDHFKDVTRHKACLLPAHHLDEAAVLALATHAYLGTGNNTL